MKFYLSLTFNKLINNLTAWKQQQQQREWHHQQQQQQQQQCDISSKNPAFRRRRLETNVVLVLTSVGVCIVITDDDVSNPPNQRSLRRRLDSIGRVGVPRQKVSGRSVDRRERAGERSAERSHQGFVGKAGSEARAGHYNIFRSIIDQ